jgi:hypothetical protein
MTNLCPVTVYSNFATVESGALSEWQLWKIYGGQDCTTTDYVAGCENIYYTNPVWVPKCVTAKTFTVDPLQPGEGPSEFIARVEAAKPSCSNDPVAVMIRR